MNILHRMRHSLEWSARPDYFVLNHWDFDLFIESAVNMKVRLETKDRGGLVCEELQWVPVIDGGAFNQPYAVRHDFHGPMIFMLPF